MIAMFTAMLACAVSPILRNDHDDSLTLPPRGSNLTSARQSGTSSLAWRKDTQYVYQDGITMDSTRRTLLTTGAAAVAAATAPRAFAQQQTGKGETAKSFYEKGNVRVYYYES